MTRIPVTRIALIALILGATTAHAHDHWSDLDGDGLLEPDEFGIDALTFGDADLDGDGVISPGEYEALLLLRANAGVAFPEAVRRAAPARGSVGDVPAPEAGFEPKVIRIRP